jgi:hypothetical protein
VRQKLHRFAAAALAAVAIAVPVPPRSAVATTCAGDTSAAGLTAAFADRVEGVTGADYQRALGLPDGRVLWTFQDAFLSRPDGADDRLVHNVGLLQDGSCFTLLRNGTPGDPAAWIAPELTDTFHRWFWPLGATLADDGTIGLFVAEFRERGGQYLSRSEPVATWLAVLDASTMSLIELRPAPDHGPSLYGWSVADDDTYTYLYGHCYRQFGFGFLGHDACTANVTVARTARGDLDGPLQYWDGENWVDDPSAAANVAPPTAPDGTTRAINPMQVARVGGRWIAVTKEGDWWGDTLYLDRADSPTGPWTTTTTITPEPIGPDHNTYFASLHPSADGSVMIGLSNNRWDGAHADGYRPTFMSVPLSQWGPTARAATDGPSRCGGVPRGR